MCEKGATGGGSNKSKKLSDTEERLLALISKIHLGSSEISDTLGCEAGSSTVISQEGESATSASNLVNLINDAEVVFQYEDTDDVQTNLLTSNNSVGAISQANVEHEAVSEKQTKKQTSRGTSSTVHGKRYSGSFIQSAAESYNEAQEKQYQASVKLAEAIESMGKSISDYAAVYAERNAIEQIKAEAEVIKANALLIQSKTEQMRLELAMLQQ